MEPGIIKKYFPHLSTTQSTQFAQLGNLYEEWNSRINVISRKDIENLYERHVLHSLGIAKILSFKPGTKVLDAGTGGGFPGIPLAILFPDSSFRLIDSTAKKLTVVQAIADETGLKNVTTEHARLEDHTNKYDFVVSRAVATLDQMLTWTGKNIEHGGFNQIPNGILYLKGGDFSEELKGMEAWGHGGMEAGKRGGREAGNYKIYGLHDYFPLPFFETKSVVHLF